jgi:hypothetical protein
MLNIRATVHEHEVLLLWKKASSFLFVSSAIIFSKTLNGILFCPAASSMYHELAKLPVKVLLECVSVCVLAYMQLRRHVQQRDKRSSIFSKLLVL